MNETAESGVSKFWKSCNEAQRGSLLTLWKIDYTTCEPITMKEAIRLNEDMEEFLSGETVSSDVGKVPSGLVLHIDRIIRHNSDATFNEILFQVAKPIMKKLTLPPYT